MSDADVSGRPWAKWVFWLALAVTFVLALLPHPPQMPGDPSDKVQHVIAFTTLTIIALWAFPQTKALWILAGLSLFGAAIEFAQAIPVLHRDSDTFDWVADTAATAIVLLMALIYRQFRKK